MGGGRLVYNYKRIPTVDSYDRNVVLFTVHSTRCALVFLPATYLLALS